VKHLELTSEKLENWKPTRRTEWADTGCRGLVIRGGPTSKVFFRWADVRDDATGEVRRKRVRIGEWPAVSLRDARNAVHEAREARKGSAGNSIATTVAQLAENYRRDVLAQREEASLAWSWGIIRSHVLGARPNPKLPPFGEWLARDVRPPDIAAVVRAAKVERTVEVTDTKGNKVTRAMGGPAAARAVLREVKAIFATAVGAGALDMSPAAVLQAKALGVKGTTRSRRLNPEELRTLFDALDLNAMLEGNAKDQKLSETVRLGIALLHYCPVRSHSLVEATWKEIDLKEVRWVIPVSKLKLHREDRANAQAFTVPLPPTAVAILRRLEVLAKDSPWVLASPRDPKHHVAPKVLVRALGRLQESGRLAAGSRFTVHDARRTWRSFAGDLRVPFEVAERSLAHKLPGVAAKYAFEEMLDRRAEAADLVAAHLDQIRLGMTAKVIAPAFGDRVAR
jgi:integrase